MLLPKVYSLGLLFYIAVSTRFASTEVSLANDYHIGTSFPPIPHTWVFASCRSCCFFSYADIKSAYLPQLSVLLLLGGDVALNPGPLKLGFANCCSMRNKGQLLYDFVNLNACDIFGLCETHIRPNNTQSFLNELTPPGFSLFQTPRVGKPGGGVGFLVKKVFDCHVVNAPTFSTFESIVISVQYSNHCIHFASI